VRTSSDLLDLITGGNGEDDAAIGYFGDSGLGGYLLSDRSCREVADIDKGTNGALTRIEERP
jgi:hypothetical protein